MIEAKSFGILLLFLLSIPKSKASKYMDTHLAYIAVQEDKLIKNSKQSRDQTALSSHDNSYF